MKGKPITKDQALVTCCLLLGVSLYPLVCVLDPHLIHLIIAKEMKEEPLEQTLIIKGLSFHSVVYVLYSGLSI